MQIRELFDTSKDIYRTIEKVITYGATRRSGSNGKSPNM
jgi:hypothetical protein